MSRPLAKQHLLLDNTIMGSVETYVKLADRPNTNRSYASAVQHFEVEGRGALPATSEAIAGYLARPLKKAHQKLLQDGVASDCAVSAA